MANASGSSPLAAMRAWDQVVSVLPSSRLSGVMSKKLISASFRFQRGVSRNFVHPSAARLMALAQRHHRGRRGLAGGLGPGAAGRETAAGRRTPGIGQLSFEAGRGGPLRGIRRRDGREERSGIGMARPVE